MLRRTRAIFSWLLLLALPVHGIAGGSMPGCGSMSMAVHAASASVTPAAAAVPESSIAASTDDADTATPCAGMSGHERSSQKTKADCAGTGACGVVAMHVPAMPAWLHLAMRTIGSAAPAFAPAVGFLTGAPERPPRTVA